MFEPVQLTHTQIVLKSLIAHDLLQQRPLVDCFLSLINNTFYIFCHYRKDRVSFC
jgi:hypothetical protein